MTAQVLGKELESIIQESKRKHNELKNAADKSLRDLRALPNTSEAQLSGDLKRRPQFASPFISACKTGSAKLALPATVCLQRLLVSGGLANERLQEVLEAFVECSKTTLDVQLKVLQALPSLLQNYSNTLEGDLQATLLQICTTLQQAKNVSVSSTASATLQQVVSSLFEKIEQEDDDSESTPISADLDLDGKKHHVRSAAHDGFRVLEDLCLITEGSQARFARGATITQSFGLELIEAILTNHGEIFDQHEEFAYLLRSRIVPMVTRFLSERLSFAVTVRTTRILCIVIREHLRTIHSECEISIGLMNHTLDSDAAGTSWRRVLCMETFRVIYSTPNLATDVYHLFDEDPNRRNLIQENLAHFVRLAAEKPALIGVGPQSSFPVGPHSSRGPSQDQFVIEAGSVAGVISGEMGVTEVNAPGISTQWSSMKTPCLDFLDKSEPPSIPETYIYSLVLNCLNSLSESLAKVVLPLTAGERSKVNPQLVDNVEILEDVSTRVSYDDEGDHSKKNGADAEEDSKKQALPISPLTSKQQAANSTVATISHMVDECWPAMLATSSTFLYAALDAEHYRALIRSVQRFTQVAGLLRLATPRDAFFTTLAKSAVPPNILKSEGPLSPGAISPRIGSSSDGFFDSPAPKPPVRRGSFDSHNPTLSQRNLMCLRALINLAIALGSTLDKSWSIIVENLQRADLVLAQSGTSTARDYRTPSQSTDRLGSEPNLKQPGLSTEISAVEAAVARLLEATVDFPNDAFLHVLRAFCDIAAIPKETPSSLNNIASPSGSLKIIRRTSSTTTLQGAAPPQTRTLHFAISKLGELARINVNRLAVDAENGGWELLSDKLRTIASSPSLDTTARLMAADIIGSIVLGITLDTVDDSPEIREEVQLRSLASLEILLQVLYRNIQETHEIATTADFDVHRAALEALRAVLEKCGDSLIAGWRSIFSIIRSTFTSEGSPSAEEDETLAENSTSEHITPRPFSPKIGRSAFACVQLICSDFLDSLKRSRIINLIDILCQFCAQPNDLNISLTTVTFFWNLSDFLQDQMDKVEDPNVKSEPLDNSSDEDTLRKAAENGSFEAMWMLLQSQLAALTNDDRVEVRNGAVQTVFRILANTGDRLAPKLWAFAFQRVILRMMDINLQNQTQILVQNNGADKQSRGRLESTTEMLLTGLSNAIAAHLELITGLDEFERIWDAMLNRFSSLLDLRSDGICTSVFNFFTQTLGASETTEAFGPNAVQKSLSLLEKNGPTPRDLDASDYSSREKSLVSYVSTLKQIYSLVKDRVGASEIQHIAENLNNCISVSSAPAYTSDVDIMTSLQAGVLECFELFRTDSPEVQSTIIERLAEFSVLPYTPSSEATAKRGLSFVAFSKRSIELLERVIIAGHQTREVYESGAMERAFSALSLSMSYKYRHEKQGKSPSMWQKSTTSALAVLPKTLPVLYNVQDHASSHYRIWQTIVEMKNHIANAPTQALPQNEALLSDESFDLEASTTLRKCFGIRLSRDEALPLSKSLIIHEGPEICAQYVNALFQSSLIHDMDARLNAKTANPLQSLYKPRQGSTIDPPFNRRIRMCYQSLDELFALATAGLNDGASAPADAGAAADPRRGDADAPLPNAAFPLLVLRCALPLKRYIADRPLRGKMPTPTSQRLELLHVLRRMRELNCVVGRAMGDGDRGDGKAFRVPVLKPWKRHLEWLLPLVHMASAHAGRDAEIADALYMVADAAFVEEK